MVKQTDFSVVHLKMLKVRILSWLHKFLKMKTIFIIHKLIYKICYFVPQAILNVCDGLLKKLLRILKMFGYCLILSSFLWLIIGGLLSLFVPQFNIELILICGIGTGFGCGLGKLLS